MKLSKKTKTVLERLQGDKGISDDFNLSRFYRGDALSRKEAVALLSKDSDKINKQNRFEIDLFRATLLKDVSRSFLTESEIRDSKRHKKNSLSSKIKLGALALAGTTFAACEGFDGITSMLSIFSGIPGSVIFGAGVGFSLLSIIVFYGFDLGEISKNLGVRLKYARNMLDVYLEQIEHIQLIRKQIDKDTLNPEQTSEAIEASIQMLDMLNARYDSLDPVRETYRHVLDNSAIKFMKQLVALLTGVLFFGSGFFAGQNLAMTLAELILPSVSASAFPIVFAGALVGLAAFSIYWFLERPGVQKLVARWFGCDEDKTAQLSDPDVVQKEKSKLMATKQRLNDKRTLDSNKQVIAALESSGENEPSTSRQLETFSTLESSGENEPSIPRRLETSSTVSRRNPKGFFDAETRPKGCHEVEREQLYGIDPTLF